MSLKKIVVIGPESTGKSTLCDLLSQHYQSPWVPEYAREYLLANGRNYTFEDLLNIAHSQIQLEDSFEARLRATLGLQDPSLLKGVARRKNTALFIDTDMYVMKVWCEFVFNRCHPWIIDQIASRRYDQYFLCKPDLPWAADELREYPDLETREKLFRAYKDILVNQDCPWVEISGSYAERFKIAKAAVDRLLS
jgi:NadR type nicotinamide-nucleotide adenylyltransferase